VLSLLRELGGIYIMGNHDKEVLELDAGEHMTDSGRKWAQWHRRSISDRNLAFLASFADACVLETQRFMMKAVHGVMPPEFGKRLWPDSSPEAFQYLGHKHVEPCILLGHSHVQFDCTRGNTRFVNPGSVGAPYLGQPLACYAVMQNGQVELRATPYDIEKTCESMSERAQGVVDTDFITDWTEGWRTGTLPKRYFIRDYGQLREQGYR
jgi:predicted phosphodiesterase